MNEEMQEILIANLTLDTYRKNNIPPLVVPQGDYGARVIKVKITKHGKNFAVESTAAVSIVAKRNGDGIANAYSGKVNADGSVTVPVTQWMLDLPDDDVVCNVVISGNGYQYSTTSFLIEPQEKANPSEITPDDPRVDIVTEVLANENARQAAEATRQANESARKTAENARQSAETQRLTDEATRVANETERVSAEASRDTTFKSWANDIALLPDMSARISRNSKRLDGLEQRIKPSPFVFDETVAYQKDVPSDAVGAVEIHKIGGMTYKSKNLINVATATKGQGGSIEINGSNVVWTYGDSNGDLFAFGVWVDVNPNTEYALSWVGTSIVVAYIYTDRYFGTLIKSISSNGTFNSGDNTRLLIGFYSASARRVGTVETINSIMFNKGDTALPYELYFEGLRSAKVTAVKSVGANLINLQDKTTAYESFVYESVKINSLPAGTYTFSCNHNIPIGIGWWVQLYDANKTAVGGTGTLGASSNEISFVTTNTAEYITIYVDSAVTISNIMLNKGPTALPYTPYQEHTLSIPEAVRPANGINAEVYDSIEWSKDGRVKTKRVKCGVVTFDGTENITFQDSISMFELVLPKESYQVSSGLGNIGLCNIYDVFTGIHNNMPDRSIVIAPLTITTRKTLVFVKDNRFATVESFKEHLAQLGANGNPFQIVYQLATPEVTDISSLITSDNLIPIEGNGILTFENEYGYATPSTVEYITAESE